MAAALLSPQVSAGVAPRSRPVPGEGVNDSDEGAGKYPSLAGNLSPGKDCDFYKVLPLQKIVVSLVQNSS